MKSRPILFSAPMVRALLAGTKTQTRRAIKPQPEMHDFGVGGIKPALTGNHVINGMLAVGCDAANGSMAYVRCPYGQPGDKLWVRETWVYRHKHDRYYYRADHPQFDPYAHGGWRPSIYMPRLASRITLDVVSVRVERLQDISDDDAQAEGVKADPPRSWIYCADYRRSFRRLWDIINGDPLIQWKSNPFVWRIEFKRSCQ